MESDTDMREAAFHSAVRENIICLLISIALYGFSYVIIRTIKKRSDHDDLFAGDEEDYLVYRISVWICTFSLAVSLGAVLLLPFSILADEILLLYPHSWYIEWLNSSLIQSLWNYVFLLSNLCVFILLPFSYFFIESQGFTGLRKGIMTRVYESMAVCSLLMIVIFCLAHLISIFMDEERARNLALFKIWNYQVPFIYSCVSMFGVVTLLICTPLGFARMFSVVGDMVVKPKRKNDLETDLLATNLEEQSIQRKLKGQQNGFGIYHQLAKCNGLNQTPNGRSSLLERLTELSKLRIQLEKQKKSMRWLQNLKYPLVMLGLLALTAVSVVMVVNNTLQLVIGFRRLPANQQPIALGNGSQTTLGPIGAALEISVIFYLMLASLVGLYSVPLLGRMKPKLLQTSMDKVIGNCMAVLILTSALPVLVRTLGITTFDLLGAYGKLDWLGNFYLVLSYNLVFAIATGLCLVTKFTSSVRQELLKRFDEVRQRVRQRHQSSESSLGSTFLDVANGINSNHLKSS